MSKPGACRRRCESADCAPRPERADPDPADRGCWNRDGHAGQHRCQDCRHTELASDARVRRGRKRREADLRISWTASVSAATPERFRAAGVAPGDALDLLAACIAAGMDPLAMLRSLLALERDIA